jgi:hypothetical protein
MAGHRMAEFALHPEHDDRSLRDDLLRRPPKPKTAQANPGGPAGARRGG